MESQELIEQALEEVQKEVSNIEDKMFLAAAVNSVQTPDMKCTISDIVTESSLKYIHIRLRADTAILPFGGYTIGYQVEESVARYAVAQCSVIDNFCRKTGREIAAVRHLAGETKVVAITNEADPRIDILKAVEVDTGETFNGRFIDWVVEDLGTQDDQMHMQELEDLLPKLLTFCENIIPTLKQPLREELEDMVEELDYLINF